MALDELDEMLRKANKVLIEYGLSPIQIDDNKNNPNTRNNTETAYNVIQTLLNDAYLILDTETTGLDEDAEIVEISIINQDGKVLLDTLIRPTKPMPADSRAMEIHGITNEMLENAPYWHQIYEQVKRILLGQNVLIYNKDFDLRLLEQTTKKYGLPTIPIKSFCAMHLFSQWYDEPNRHWSNSHTYRWQSLAAAADIARFTPNNAHRALSDCQTTQAVLKLVVAVKTPNNIPAYFAKESHQKFKNTISKYLANMVILNINHFCEIKKGSSTQSEVVDITILDIKGNKLLHTLVKPQKRYKDLDFLQITGYDLSLFEKAPEWKVVAPKVASILKGKIVLVSSKQGKYEKNFIKFSNERSKIDNFDFTVLDISKLCSLWKYPNQNQEYYSSRYQEWISIFPEFAEANKSSIIGAKFMLKLIHYIYKNPPSYK